MKPSDPLDHVNNLLKYVTESVLKTGGGDYASAIEVVQAATSILGTVYGPGSVQLKQFQDCVGAVYKRTERHSGGSYELILASKGVLQSLKRELDTGIVGSLQLAIAGDVLT